MIFFFNNLILLFRKIRLKVKFLKLYQTPFVQPLFTAVPLAVQVFAPVAVLYAKVGYRLVSSETNEIVAVSLDGQKSKWEKTVEENNFNWTNICQFKVYKSPICLDYKIKKTPSIFVLNNNMEIVLKPKSTNQLRSFLLANK